MRKGGGRVSRMLSRVPITLAAKPRPSPWPRLFWRQKNELLLSVTLKSDVNTYMYTSLKETEQKEVHDLPQEGIVKKDLLWFHPHHNQMPTYMHKNTEY